MLQRTAAHIAPQPSDALDQVADRTNLRIRQSKQHSLFVNFGGRAFACKVDGDEIGYLPAHALNLARAQHVLQRLLTRYEDIFGDDVSGFSTDDRENASIGLDFLSGMVAQMLEAAEVGGDDGDLAAAA